MRPGRQRLLRRCNDITTKQSRSLYVPYVLFLEQCGRLNDSSMPAGRARQEIPPRESTPLAAVGTRASSFFFPENASQASRVRWLVDTDDIYVCVTSTVVNVSSRHPPQSQRCCRNPAGRESATKRLPIISRDSQLPLAPCCWPRLDGAVDGLRRGSGLSSLDSVYDFNPNVICTRCLNNLLPATTCFALALRLSLSGHRRSQGSGCRRRERRPMGSCGRI